MNTRCKPGDLAIVIDAWHPCNLGTIVPGPSGPPIVPMRSSSTSMPVRSGGANPQDG